MDLNERIERLPMDPTDRKSPPDSQASCLCNHSAGLHVEGAGACAMCACTVFEEDPLFTPVVAP